MKINKKDSLGQIVSKYPSTVQIFNNYKLDYCCGGNDTLELAIKDLKLNEEEVIKDLKNSLINYENFNLESKKWEDESMSNIINYILDNHHTFMKDILSEINILMFKILKVHYKTDGEVLLKVHSLFGSLKTELEAHLIKEEENLFPLILKYEETKENKYKNEILKFINDTESEHDAAGDVFKKLEKLTNNYVAPKGACYSYKRTYELLDALEKDTFNHIHMENSILFKKI